MEKEKNPIELKSEAIEELLGMPPGWLTRWGITLFFGIILVLLIGCHFFKYPEVTTAPIVLTTEEPVSWIVARKSGIIDSILVADKEFVQKNKIVGVIRNAASLEDVMAVKKGLQAVQDSTGTLDELAQLGPVRLGELHTAFFELLKYGSNYRQFVRDQVYSHRIEAIEIELKEQVFYLSALKQQSHLYARNFQLISNQYKRDSILYAKDMITQADFEKAQQQYISGQMQLSQSYQGISNTISGIARLRQAVRDYEAEYNSQLASLTMNIKGAVDQLVVSIELWEQNYLLRASADGMLSYSDYWSKNQNVTEGEKIFAVIPEITGKKIGKCVLAAAGAGKVEVGQHVNIKLDGFPYMEFGMLQGKVSDISMASSEATTPEGVIRYNTVEVELDDPLITTYNKEIKFTSELSGTAEIATQELSLLEHFMMPLRYLWEKF